MTAIAAKGRPDGLVTDWPIAQVFEFQTIVVPQVVTLHKHYILLGHILTHLIGRAFRSIVKSVLT